MKFQFSLSWVLVAFMVVAFSLAVFGRFGIAVGVGVIGVGAFVQVARSRQRAIERVVMGLIAVLPFLCLGIVTGPSNFGSHGDARCVMNLVQINMALHRYRLDCGSLPPVRTFDSRGKSMHSWRVLLLPHLERDTLLQQYDWSEPWNGPKNSSLTSKMPGTYECSMDQKEAQQGTTRYVAVVGADGTWLEPTSGSFKESNPVRLVEAGSLYVWMEPRDLSLEDVCIAARECSASGLESKHTIEGKFFFCDRPAGANAMFADGSWRLIPPGVPVDVLRAALLGDRKQQERLDTYAAATRRVNWPNCASLAGLVASFIAMLAWPRQKQGEPSKTI